MATQMSGWLANSRESVYSSTTRFRRRTNHCNIHRTGDGEGSTFRLLHGWMEQVRRETIIIQPPSKRQQQQHTAYYCTCRSLFAQRFGCLLYDTTSTNTRTNAGSRRACCFAYSLSASALIETISLHVYMSRGIYIGTTLYLYTMDVVLHPLTSPSCAAYVSV